MFFYILICLFFRGTTSTRRHDYCNVRRTTQQLKRHYCSIFFLDFGQENITLLLNCDFHFFVIIISGSLNKNVTMKQNETDKTQIKGTTETTFLDSSKTFIGHKATIRHTREL